MAVKGVNKLPVKMNEKDALSLYKRLAEVNKTLGKLDAVLLSSVVNTSILSLLSYNESVQSTRIEGTQVTFHEIMESSRSGAKNWQQREVLNYKQAIDEGFTSIRDGDVISTRLLKKLHKILMSDEARGTTADGGEFRKVQNFIGPDNKIENASYIPISANEIADYMTNLEFFANGEPHRSLKIDEGNEYINYNSDALLRIAVVHAQFESIHPFLDGNGRLGRILIALMAVKEKLLDYPVFFVSEELEKERIRYYNALNAVRGDTPDWNPWLTLFLNASEQMAINILKKIGNADKHARNGLEVCKTQAQKDVWLSTFNLPVATPKQLAELTGHHPATVKKSLEYLVEKKLLDKDNAAKRNIPYYNYDLIRVISSS
ncbi:Fic family protein [Streptococcus pantholopis]|uniref:Fic/DOC family protein n=1 Tax=Streptococcus pantholopis TaxID=1811193 RepID=A0A172Q9K4_9STRE|nr:Fic family protein [Streptococcus pantholopis]AND80112.1 Fic/DOC family protein [Streptococcus pantholopis]